MAEEKGSLVHTCMLVSTILLLVVSLALSAAGLVNPSWQVVDITEFRAEHHHGLWLDCTVPARHLAMVSQRFADGSAPKHCTYKFDMSANQIIDENIQDIDQNSAAGESEHHQFFGWHKAVLIFLIFSILFTALALISALCARCSGGCAVIFSILVFIALFTAIVGDAIFFFAAHRVDSRFVQGLVGTYEQMIGAAFYLHGSGTTVLLFAFILSIVTSYQMLQQSRYQRQSAFPVRELGMRYRETSFA